MAVTLKPVNDENRDAVIALSVREDQPFVAPNDYSLEQAAESNREHPGVAHAYGIYTDDSGVGVDHPVLQRSRRACAVPVHRA